MLLYNYPVLAYITGCTNITGKRQEVGLLKICIQNHDYKQKEGTSRTEGQRGKAEAGEKGRENKSLMKQLQNANKLLKSRGAITSVLVETPYNTIPCIKYA